MRRLPAWLLLGRLLQVVPPAALLDGLARLPGCTCLGVQLQKIGGGRTLGAVVVREVRQSVIPTLPRQPCRGPPSQRQLSSMTQLGHVLLPS